jgi:hypothetical protein
LAAPGLTIRFEWEAAASLGGMSRSGTVAAAAIISIFTADMANGCLQLGQLTCFVGGGAFSVFSVFWQCGQRKETIIAPGKDRLNQLLKDNRFPKP